MKAINHDLDHDLTFSAHTINCVCHSIRSMFRVLGICNMSVGSWYQNAICLDQLFHPLFGQKEKQMDHVKLKRKSAFSNPGLFQTWKRPLFLQPKIEYSKQDFNFCQFHLLVRNHSNQVQYCLTVFNIFWTQSIFSAWSKVRLYLINLHTWAWSKILNRVKIFLNQ